MFQADTFIQHLLTKRTVDIVVGNDTDFAVVAGEACLQITSFRLTCNKKKDAVRTLNQITISTGFKATIEKCRKHLGTVGIFNDAKIPLLDDIRDLPSCSATTRCQTS